eukprot:SAG31_NODE_553_length_14198_cov_3.418257_2_plen_219_part_00
MYSGSCHILHSRYNATLGSGNCDLDIDECASAPCLNGATCSDSTTDSSISIDQHSCNCTDGWAVGMCAYEYLAEYTAECNVRENGTCSLDVDECQSNPCRNGATCSDSNTVINGSDSPPISSFGCACSPGWANGTCELGHLTPHFQIYAPLCNVTESAVCDVDMDEWCEKTDILLTWYLSHCIDFQRCILTSDVPFVVSAIRAATIQPVGILVTMKLE